VEKSTTAVPSSGKGSAACLGLIAATVIPRRIKRKAPSRLPDTGRWRLERGFFGARALRTFRENDD